LGEAAAFLLLEPAPREGVLGYVQGWGCTADAHHMTAPHPEGVGAAAAIRAALEDAGVSTVDYVNAHGTATPANDKTESLALKAVFGDRIPPTSSIKGATGHTLGAAGALEAAISVLCLQRGWMPGNIGLIEQDPECAVPLVPPGGTRAPFSRVLSSSFGFGGNNTALVLGKEDR
ncbi:MAG: beta-ketoacyl-[acyl-carrier-protein] synthase II, partial [Myxococcaceae bacterium]